MTRPHLATIRHFTKTTTFRLGLSYLAIILLMSIGFSIVFYRTSSQQLGRQLPPRDVIERQFHNGSSGGTYQSGLQPMANGFGAGGPADGSGSSQSDNSTVQDNGSGGQAVRDYLQARIREGRTALRLRLLVLNLAALVLGAILSYYLARRTLRPIEANMEAQSQFVSDASHELRTPLTAMQTSNEVALRRPKLSDPEARRIITDNITDLGRLRSLTDGLLKLARSDHTAARLVPVKLSDSVSDAINQLIPAASAKDIAIDDTVGSQLAMSEPAVLTQLLVILLDNAVKYSPAGSTVTLATETHGKSQLLHVSDRGAGIAEADIPHIFDRFYRASAARTVSTADGPSSGYGLGLSIADKLAGQLGATVSVKSTLGKGSTFTVRMPAV